MSGQHIVRRVVQAIYLLRQTRYPPILAFGATRQQTSRQKKQQAGGWKSWGAEAQQRRIPRQLPQRLKKEGTIITRISWFMCGWVNKVGCPAERGLFVLCTSLPTLLHMSFSLWSELICWVRITWYLRAGEKFSRRLMYGYPTFSGVFKFHDKAFFSNWKVLLIISEMTSL